MVVAGGAREAAAALHRSFAHRAGQAPHFDVQGDGGPQEVVVGAVEPGVGLALHALEVLAAQAAPAVELAVAGALLALHVAPRLEHVQHVHLGAVVRGRFGPVLQQHGRQPRLLAVVGVGWLLVARLIEDVGARVLGGYLLVGRDVIEVVEMRVSRLVGLLGVLVGGGLDDEGFGVLQLLFEHLTLHFLAFHLFDQLFPCHVSKVLLQLLDDNDFRVLHLL